MGNRDPERQSESANVLFWCIIGFALCVALAWIQPEACMAIGVDNLPSYCAD